jgi:hypothetical protein
MILLDENIPADQADQLRRWRIRFKQIGLDLGRFGMKDREEILPLLHRLSRVTFFTRDLGFYDLAVCHPRYAIACLHVPRSEAAAYIRRVLRHPQLNTTAKRIGKVMCITPTAITYWAVGTLHQTRLAW